MRILRLVLRLGFAAREVRRRRHVIDRDGGRDADAEQHLEEQRDSARAIARVASDVGYVTKDLIVLHHEDRRSDRPSYWIVGEDRGWLENSASIQLPWNEIVIVSSVVGVAFGTTT